MIIRRCADVAVLALLPTGKVKYGFRPWARADRCFTEAF